MVYITGDTHRNFDAIEEFCEDNETTKDDIIIILGDVGINYLGEREDFLLKCWLVNLPITLFCIHGNHEIRPFNISSYELVERYGGMVYMEEDFPNLLFAKDSEIYEFDGKRCIVIGGAFSFNRDQLIPGIDWWDDEQPDEIIKAEVEERLEAEGWNVDIVLSHTGPAKYIPKELVEKRASGMIVDRSTEDWLDKIEDKLTYSEWYCGHWHIEEYFQKMRFMNVSDMGTIMELGEW